MVYSIDGIVVCGTAFSISNLVSPVILNLSGEVVPIREASLESDTNRDKDSFVTTRDGKVLRNVELGTLILNSMWSDLVKRDTGSKKTLIKDFEEVQLALLSGMLLESSELIQDLKVTTLVTVEFKNIFEQACISADHLK